MGSKLTSFEGSMPKFFVVLNFFVFFFNFRYFLRLDQKCNMMQLAAKKLKNNPKYISHPGTMGQFYGWMWILSKKFPGRPTTEYRISVLLKKSYFTFIVRDKAG